MKRFSSVLIGIAVLCLVIVPLIGCGVPKSDYEALQNENAGLQVELAEAQANLAKVQADYVATSNELAKIKEVYPLRDFASYSELEQWVKSHVQLATPYATGSFQSALKVVQLGEEQGYRINIDIDYYEDTDTYLIGCNAFEGGLFYWWNPESGNIYPYDSAFRK